MNDPFLDYAPYYDLFYADKDYAGETRHIAALIGKPGTLIDLGSGTGRHAHAFRKLGFKVTAVERSPEMAHRSVVPCDVGDILTVRYEKEFDAATALFHVVSYLSTNPELRQFFQNVARHLKTGGILVFDAWYTPNVKPETRVKFVGNNVARVAEPILLPELNCVDVNYTIFGHGRTHRSTHRMRHFSIPEIELYGELAGLELIRYEVREWDCLFVLRKGIHLASS